MDINSRVELSVVLLFMESNFYFNRNVCLCQSITRKQGSVPGSFTEYIPLLSTVRLGHVSSTINSFHNAED